MTSTIDKIRKEVDRLVEEARNNPGLRWDVPEYILGVQAILPFLDTLQEQEPQGLDEAAEKWCKENCKGFVLRDKTSRYVGDGIDAFKAGAEWMAGQGETIEGIVSAIGNNRWVDLDDRQLDKQLAIFKDGDKVIVQIRKK